MIKAALAWDWVQATTGFIRYYMNVWVLVPTEKALLYVPTPAMIIAIAALCYRLGGLVPGILALIFFSIVAELGYWDRAMLTLHSVFMATFIAFLIGVPLAIYERNEGCHKTQQASNEWQATKCTACCKV